jgi:hypothetical protein
MPSLLAIALVAVCEPASYLRATRIPENPMWETVVNTENLSLSSNSTWELVRYSRDMKVIGPMWKFKLKRDSKGNIGKY